MWDIEGSQFSMMSGGPYAIGTLTFRSDNTVHLARAFPDRPLQFGVAEYLRDGAGQWTQTDTRVHFQIVGNGFSGWDFEGTLEGRRMYGNARSTTGASCQWQAILRGGGQQAAPPAVAPAAGSPVDAKPDLAPLPREEEVNRGWVSAAGYYGLEAGEADSKKGKSKDASRHADWVRNKFGPNQAYMNAFINDYNKSYDAEERSKRRQPTW